MTIASESERLAAIAEIVRYERANGTWRTVRKYNIFFGDTPGNNVWIHLRNGQTCDLGWMFDLAVVAMPVANGPDVPVLKRIAPGVGHVYHGVRQAAGASTAGLAYMFGRFMGGAANAAAEKSWKPLGEYIKGGLNEDNANGLRAANHLVMGATIESLIHPKDLKAAGL